MAATPDKRSLREAAEKIERAVDAYGAGDLAGSSRLFEEALALMPEHERAKLYLGWVRDLSSGKKKLGGIDEETLQAISDTLQPDEEQTREKRSIEIEAEPGDESPWDPVPLTPGGQKGEQVAPIASAPPIDPRARKKTPPPTEAKVKPPSSTLLGMPPAGQPSLLTPTGPKGLYDSTENTGSVTREWNATPTGTNLPPLDVPELTDEQIQELLALDGSPIALDAAPPGPPPPQAPRLETLTDLGLGPAEPERMLEMVAEPTPEPHMNPLRPTHVPLLPDADATQPRAQGRRRDSTTPDADIRSFQSNEFDTLEQTPTRDRGDLLRAVVEHQPTGGSDEDLQLPPLEAPVRDDILGEGTNPTNPFIKRRLAEYSYGTGQQPKVEDLPPAPGLNDTNRQPIVGTLQAIQEPLDRGEIGVALEAAEKFLADQGGLDGEAVQPHYWLFERVYENSLGSLQAIPKHGQAVVDLDPRSAFILSRLDGMSSVEDLLDVSGMPRLEALRVLALLVRRGVVTVK